MAEYTQIKVAAKPEIAAAYKATCKATGVKMAADIANFMAKRSGTLDKLARRQATSTRRRRREEIGRIADRVEELMDEESTYLQNIPENLQGGQRYSAAEETVEALAEACDLLRGAYD